MKINKRYDGEFADIVGKKLNEKQVNKKRVFTCR